MNEHFKLQSSERLCGQLTIFEGPDGAGKSTLARAYADATGARYASCGPLLNLSGPGLWSHYAGALAPTIFGPVNLVLDRCWLSEMPYGAAERGTSRLVDVDLRMLERMALRAETVVVRCLPPMEVCEKNWEARRGGEYLPHRESLRRVWELYASRFVTDLPVFEYDYTAAHLSTMETVDLLRVTPRSQPHPLRSMTAGNRLADAVIVVSEREAPRDLDPFYQLPYISPTSSGARCITRYLEQHEVGERMVSWAYADDPALSYLCDRPRRWVALGEKASASLSSLQVQGPVLTALAPLLPSDESIPEFIYSLEV